MSWHVEYRCFFPILQHWVFFLLCDRRHSALWFSVFQTTANEIPLRHRFGSLVPDHVGWNACEVVDNLISFHFIKSFIWQYGAAQRHHSVRWMMFRSDEVLVHDRHADFNIWESLLNTNCSVWGGQLSPGT
jgi:hypothetical protein